MITIYSCMPSANIVAASTGCHPNHGVALFHILPGLIYIQKTIIIQQKLLICANDHTIPLTILFGQEENASRYVVSVSSVAEVTLKAFEPTSISWGLPYIIVQQHALAWVGLNRAWASHRECARRVPVGSYNHLPSIWAFILFYNYINKTSLKKAAPKHKQSVWLQHLLARRETAAGLSG